MDISTKPYKFPEYVSDQIKTIVLEGKTHYSMGSYVASFENEFAKQMGSKYAFATTSGTSALQLALHALDLKPGDEVIMPAYTFIAVAQAILSQGAIPVFVDLDETFNISPKKIKESITSNTKAIIVVHMFGNVAQLDAICEIAQVHNLKLIEDCAQAIGAEFAGKKVGSIGDIGCYSFNVKKAIPLGEGGMLITSDSKLAKRIKIARSTGICKEEKDVVSTGYTLFMTEMQGALGLAAIKDLNELNQKRRNNARILFNELAKIGPKIILPKIIEKSSPAFSRIVFKIDEEKIGLGRDDFIKKLNEKNIPMRSFYPRVLYFYKLFRERKGFPFKLSQMDYTKVECPNAENFCQKHVAMEFSPYLTKEHVRYIAEKIIEVANG